MRKEGLQFPRCHRNPSELTNMRPIALHTRAMILFPRTSCAVNQFFLVLLPGLLTCCVTSVSLNDVIGSMAERSRGPLPESRWNELGIWRRVADQPPTYIPKGYSISAPRTEKDGQWFDDKRDGKRLFVPNTEVNVYASGVLQGEARKITNWQTQVHAVTEPGILAVP
jgi:hypothetical protein